MLKAAAEGGHAEDGRTHAVRDHVDAALRLAAYCKHVVDGAGHVAAGDFVEVPRASRGSEPGAGAQVEDPDIALPRSQVLRQVLVDGVGGENQPAMRKAVQQKHRGLRARSSRASITSEKDGHVRFSRIDANPVLGALQQRARLAQVRQWPRQALSGLQRGGVGRRLERPEVGLEDHAREKQGDASQSGPGARRVRLRQDAGLAILDGVQQVQAERAHSHGAIVTFAANAHLQIGQLAPRIGVLAAVLEDFFPLEKVFLPIRLERQSVEHQAPLADMSGQSQHVAMPSEAPEIAGAPDLRNFASSTDVKPMRQRACRTGQPMAALAHQQRDRAVDGVGDRQSRRARVRVRAEFELADDAGNAMSRVAQECGDVVDPKRNVERRIGGLHPAFTGGKQGCECVARKPPAHALGKLDRDLAVRRWRRRRCQGRMHGWKRLRLGGFGTRGPGMRCQQEFDVALCQRGNGQERVHAERSRHDRTVEHVKSGMHRPARALALTGIVGGRRPL